MKFSCYCGTKLTTIEINDFKNRVGAKITTNEFLSMSRNRDIANESARKPSNSKRMEIEAVLFEIEIDLFKSTTTVADITHLRKYKGEKQVLFNLDAWFMVNSVNYDQREQLWLTKLIAGDDRTLVNHPRLQIFSTEPNSRLQQLSYEMYS
jgi:hypothetical protein